MKRFALRLLSSNYFRVPAAALLLYAIIGFAVLPFAIRWYLPRWSTEHLKSKAEVAKVRINPFVLTMDAHNFSLTSPDGVSLAGFDKLHVNLDIGNPFKRALVIHEFNIENPTANIVIEPDGSINAAGLTGGNSKPEPEGTEDKTSPRAPLRLILGSFSLTGGKLTLTDKRIATPATVVFQDLALELKGISTFQDRNGSCSFSAKTGNGETFDWRGGVSFSPFRSSGHFDIGGLYAKTLWGFAKDSLNLDAPAGKMDLATDYHFNLGGPAPQFALENLRFNLADLSLKLTGAKDSFLDLGKFDIDSTRFDLASRQVKVGKVLIDGGAFRAMINKGGGINLLQVVKSTPAQSEKAGPPAPAQAAPQAAAGPPWTADIEAVDLKNIALAFEDLSLGSPMSAAVSSLSASSKVRIEAGATQKVLVQQIGTQLGGVRLGIKDLPEPLFEAAKIDLDGGELDLSGRSIVISHVRVSDGRFDATRDKDGRTGFERLAAPGNETSAKPAPSAASAHEPPWKYLVKDFEISKFHTDLRDLAVSQTPLYRITDLNVRVSGIDGKSPMDFDAGFSLDQGGKAAFKGKVDPSGKSVEAAINVASFPLTPLQPYLGSYVTLILQSGAVSTKGTLRYGIPGSGAKLVYQGSLGLDKLRLDQPGAKEPEIGWQALQIPQLALNVDPNGLKVQEIKLSKPVGHMIIAEDKTLNLAKMIKEQPSPSKPRAAPEKGSTSPGHGASKGQSSGAFPFTIGRVLIDGGDITFADLSLKPKFGARIHDLKGQISKLSSEGTQPSTIKLQGGVDKYGSVKVDGSIVLDDYKRSTELTMAFRNVEMATMTPYSGKFAGRTIKSGKLSMDLHYKIRQSKMEGDNKIIVQNLVLGEHVNSPDAVNLPLDIAVALLTDSKGRIELGLPVSGDLNNPQFSIAPLIWKAFSAMLTKLVTAPFRALGGLLGGGAGKEDIQLITFDAGSAEVAPPEKEKLVKVAEALAKRPRLGLAVQGRYSSGSDAAELKRASIVKAVYSELGTGGKAASEPLDFSDSKTGEALEKLYVKKFGKPSLDELEQAVRDGKIKPRAESTANANPKGRKASMLSKIASAVNLDRVLPGLRSPQEWSALSSEMFWRLVESQPFPEKDLIQLAESRGRAVVSELQTAGIKDSTRVQTRKPEAVKENEEPSAKLFLEAR